MLERTTQPQTLIEKLEHERSRLNKQANDDIDAVSKENHAYQVGLIGGLTNAIDIVKQHSDWRVPNHELPPDEVDCIFETYDGWVFVGDYREKRGIVNHRHGYEMIEDIKRWKPLSLKSEVQDD